jgi:HEPN domain-containing protein
MAQSEPRHTEVDLRSPRKLLRRAIRDLEQVNRELAQKDERIAALEARLAAEFGIDYTTEVPHG